MQIDKSTTGEYTRFFKKNPELVTFLTEQNISLEEAVASLREDRKNTKIPFDLTLSRSFLMLAVPISIPIIGLYSLSVGGNPLRFLSGYANDFFQPKKAYAQDNLKDKMSEHVTAIKKWEQDYNAGLAVFGSPEDVLRTAPKPVFKL